MKKITMKRFLQICLLIAFILINPLKINAEFNFANTNLPDYYNENGWLENKLSKVQSNSNISNGIKFVFITDLHFAANSGYSAELIRRVVNRSNASLVINGGDQVRAYGTQTDIETDATTFKNFADSLNVPVYAVRGNHDYTIRESSTSSQGYTFTHDWSYNMLMSSINSSTIVGPSGKMYYYVDDTTNKVRYIFLDGYDGSSYTTNQYWAITPNISTEQIKWFINTALNADGYKFIVTMHGTANPNMYYNFYSTNWGIIHRIEQALNNRRNFEESGTDIKKDFTDATSYILFNLNGDTHLDESNLYDGVLTVGTTSDAHYSLDSGFDRSAGTVNEHAFDFISINFDNKTIKTTRIGGGEDRSWTYTEPNAKVEIGVVNEKNELVQGVKLSIKGTKGYKKTVTTTSSKVNLTNLPYDTYTIEQTTALEGYSVAAKQTVTLNSADKKAVTLSSYKTKVSISNLDAKQNTQIKGSALEVQDLQGNVVNKCNGTSCKWETTANAYEIVGLTEGSYYLVQKNAAPGYYINKEKVLFEVKNDGVTVNVVIKNNKTKTIISNVDSKEEKELSGFNLEIQNLDGNVVKYCSGNQTCKWVTTESSYQVEGLPVGKYYLVQTSAPDKYRVNKEKVLFEVKNDGSTTNVEMKNKLTKVKISLIDKSTKLLLSGAMFELQDKDGHAVKYCIDEKGNKNVECKWETKEKVYEIEGLPKATYYLVQISSLDGYYFNDSRIEFQVTNEDSDKIVEVKNEKNQVKILKVNSVDKRPLDGAKLAIQDKDGNIVKYCIDEKGNKNIECVWISTKESKVIEGLPLGKYYLVEIESPNGYELNKEKIEFEVNSNVKIVELEMINQLEVDVPDTLSAKSALLLTIAMIIVAIGVTVLTLVKTKNN